MTTFIKSKTAKAILGLLVVAAFAFVGAARSSAAFTFVNNLSMGMTSPDVMELQKALNANGFTVSTSGAGSSGMESNYFGSKTKAAVMAFQTAKSISPVAGYVGPITRGALNALGGGGSGNLPQGCTSTQGFSPITGQPCSGSVTTGGMVSLATNNPAAGILVETQAGAELLRMTFSGNYTVTNVELNRTGISTSSTLSNIYLFDGATRLTDAASVNSMGIVTWNQPSGLFTVSGSRTITVRADVADTTSGQTVGISFKSAMAGTTPVTGSAIGNIFSIAANPSTMSALAFGTVTPTGATINPAANLTLWQSVGTVSNNDVYVDRMAFRQVGSAPATAFANFKLYINGVQVASATGLDSNGYVTFVPASPVLVTGAKIFRVDADVVGGASRTVQLSLRTAADLGVRDSQLGVNITATGIPAVASSANTISGASGGTLTIEKDVSSPSSNIVLNGSDVTYGKYKLTAYGEAIKVETLILGMDSSDASVTALRNGRVVINGVQYGSTASLLEAGTTYTLNYTVYPGTPAMLEIHADVYDSDGTNNMTAGDTVTVSIDAGSSNAQRVDSLGTFSTPSSAIDANTLTVATTALTLSKNTTFANPTVVLPQTNMKLGSWNLVGSSVEDVLVTTLSFDVDEVSGTEFDEGDMNNMYAVVKSGSTVVYTTSPVSTVSATDNNFSLNYTIAKNASVSIELFANLSDDGSDSAIDSGDSVKTDLTVTGTSLVSGQSITATSADTDGQTLAAGTASITATLDASSPVAAIVYDNQTVRTAAFKFAAVTSGYKITDLTFDIDDATTVQSVNISSTTENFSASMPGGTTVTFSGLDWDIPANTNAVLNVDLVLGEVSYAAGTSGASLDTDLTAGTATSASTGTSAAITESDPSGNAMYVYAAIPVITQQTLASNNLLNTASRPLLRFKVDASGGTIGWSRLFFEITKDSATVLASATLWDVTGGGNTQVAGSATHSTTGAGSTSGTIEFDATTEQQVSSTKTYELRGTVTLADASGDFITTTMSQEGAYAAQDSAADVETADSDATIIWSDLSASSHDTTTNDWAGDYGVKNLPVSDSLNWPN